MKYVLLIYIILFAHIQVQAQNAYAVSGSVKDSIGHAITTANIWLIIGKDSIYTTTNGMGIFSFYNVSKPIFKLRITLLGYNTRELNYSYNDTHITIPPITLYAKMNTLKEVVVKGKFNPMLMKGDTLEYNIDQYEMREYAVVEDFLKRLPGIQVDKDGNITAMGSKVAKIRINGKEFMVNNIQVLTRLLPASMISKIQLIDDYGVMARITGRKISEADKVINLQTKEPVNNFYRLELLAGAGNAGRYNTNLLANVMNDRYQLLLVGGTNNMNTTVGNNIRTDGMLTYQVKANEKVSLNTDLVGEHNSSSLQSVSSVKTVTSNGDILSIDNNYTEGTNKKFNFKQEDEFIISKNDLVNFRLNTIVNDVNTRNTYTSKQTGIQRKDQFMENVTTGKTSNFSTEIIASHRFNNSGRILTANIFLNYATDKNKQESNNRLSYYNSNGTIVKDSILQQTLNKKYSNGNSKLQLSYIEPIDSLSNIELKYTNLTRVDSNSLQTQWINPEGKNSVIDSLSNQYKYTVIQQQVELNYLRNNNKISYNFGANLLPYILRGKSLSSALSNTVNGTIIAPVFRIVYNHSPTDKIILSYTGSSTFPTYQQIQPITDLTNPQLPITGNPDLRTSFKDAITLSYRKTGITNIFIHLNANITRNSIVTNTLLIADSFNTVKQETRFLNTSGVYGFFSYYTLHRQFAGAKHSISFSGSNKYDNAILYLNGMAKSAKNLVLDHDATLNLNYKWLEFTTRLNYIYNHNVYILGGGNITTLNTWNVEFHAKLFFSKNISFSTDISKQFNSGYEDEISANPLIVEAMLQKILLNGKVFCRLQGYNLLDQKTQVSQTITENTITRNSDNLMGRRIILTFFLNFALLMGKK